MKVALIIGGRLTCETVCLLPQLINYRHSHLSIDLYVSLNMHESHRPDIEKRMLDANVVKYNFEEYILTEQLSEKMQGSKVGRRNMMSMFYHNQRAFEMIKESGIAYDCVVKFRPDIVSDHLPDFSKLSPDSLHIPDGNEYGGLNDQICFGSLDMMQIYCNVYSSVCELLNRPEKVNARPEMLLKSSLSMYHIRLERSLYIYYLHPDRALIGEQKPNQMLMQHRAKQNIRVAARRARMRQFCKRVDWILIDLDNRKLRRSYQ